MDTYTKVMRGLSLVSHKNPGFTGEKFEFGRSLRGDDLQQNLEGPESMHPQRNKYTVANFSYMTEPEEIVTVFEYFPPPPR